MRARRFSFILGSIGLAGTLLGCGGGGGGGGGGGSPTSAQIAAARAAPDGATSLSVADALVTYVKPAVGTEPAGFFVQGDVSGPALFVAVDPVSLAPVPAAGDRVSFTVTAMGTIGSLREATAVAAFARTSSGNPLAPLLKDVSSSTDLVSAVDQYESELVSCQGTISGPFVPSGSGYVSAPFATPGLSADPNLELRVPSALRLALDLAPGCVVHVLGTPLWRFNAVAQVSAWSSSDVDVISCSAPAVTTAAALGATSVRVTFDRQIDPSSVLPNGSQFTFSGGLTSSSAVVVGAQVTVATNTQVAGTAYIVTVAGTVQDTLGAGVDPTANSAAFAGFQAPARLRLNEVNPNVTGSRDLLELLVVTAGAMNGITIVQNPSSDGTGATLLATLPNVVVAVGDLIVVHLTPAAGVMTETGAKTNCIDASCYAGAWDVRGENVGIAVNNRVLSILGPDGTTIQDAAPFVVPSLSSPPAAFLTTLNYIQSQGAWLPADSGGVPTTYSTTPGAVTISVDWSGASLTNTVKRSSALDTDNNTGWTLSASTMGAP